MPNQLMTREAIESIEINEGKWRKLSDFVCNKCGQPAYANPYTDSILGCKKCNFATRSVFMYFHSISNKNSLLSKIRRRIGRY